MDAGETELKVEEDPGRLMPLSKDRATPWECVVLEVLPFFLFSLVNLQQDKPKFSRRLGYLRFSLASYGQVSLEYYATSVTLGTYFPTMVAPTL